MSEDTRARARAQYFGPEMLEVIGVVMGRIDAEIRKARQMSAAEITALLLALREPLASVRARATLAEDDPSGSDAR